MTCPITGCCAPVPGELRVCSAHYRLIPRPQQEALSFYAKKNKGGKAHQASFARAVESIDKVIAASTPKQVQAPVALPYRDD